MDPDRRSQLVENAQDALLALAMYDLMRSEGEQWEAERERLNSDAAFSVPAQIDRQNLRTIRRSLSEKERRRALNLVRRAAVRFAVAFLAVFIVFSFTFATVSAVRGPVLQLVVRTFGKGATLSTYAPEVDDTPSVGPRWLPPGFVTEVLVAEDSLFIIIYRYDDGRFIEYSESPDDGSLVIDVEDVDFSEYATEDRTFLFAEKNGMLTVYWTEERSSGRVICELAADRFDRDTVWQILQRLR